MKILLLTDRLDRGGAETHIVTLSAAIKRLGHSLLVVSSGGALKSELLRQGIAHLTLPFDQKTPTSYLYCRA